MGGVILAVVVTMAMLLSLAIAARRAITICVVDVHDGRARVTRGGIAPRILADVRDVVAAPPVTRATIRIVRSHGSAALLAKGDLTDGQRQRIRNVIGSVPLAKLLNVRGRGS
jgi:hypothetical protein